MRKTILLLALTFFALSCSKDDESKTEDVATVYSGSFGGTVTNYGNSSYIMGGVAVKADGKITIDLLSGKLVGTTEETDEGYAITVSQATGIFQNVNDISGTLDTESGALSVGGTNLDGSSHNVTGHVEVMTTGGWENLTKTAVRFTHDEADNIASVTINGLTLGGLNRHYEGGYCNANYDPFRNMMFNYDDGQGDVSETLCHTGTLIGLNGNPVTYTDCSVTQFILDKETHYTYTVNWSNGETYSGEFTTGGGGTSISICLTAEGGTGGGGGNGSAQISFDGSNYTMNIVTQNDNTSCSPITKDFYFQQTNTSHNPGFLVKNMPSQSSGTFQLSSDGFGCSAPFMAFNVPNSPNCSYESVSGTITKTGARSFTFTASVYNDCTSETFNVSGSGSY